MHYYIYILYSASADKYYIGYSNNFIRRLTEHNESERSTYTKKYRPWILKAAFDCGISERDAMRIEKFLKHQKSRKLIETLCGPGYIPEGYLALLVRVPHVRD